MQTTFLTNVLLIVIAALLIVLVIQNGMQESSSSTYTYSNSQSSESSSGSGGSAGMSNAMPMGQSMLFQALSAFPQGCKGHRTLGKCNSPAAQAVKSEILQYAQTASGPRAIFDFVVNKWGMKALTPEAQRIRGMRTSK